LPVHGPPPSAERVVCAILAAGSGTRLGLPKTALRLGTATLLERALAACGAYERIVVAAAANAAEVPAGVRTIVNDAPERGMTHSLRLADAAVADRDAALVVLLADTPFVDATLVARVLAARGAADVAYPVRAGRPGHPVVFGPRPRALIAALPDGDTLRTLRADPRWTRVEVDVADERPFLDVDTPEDVERARAALAGLGGPAPASN
jgi:molybdenum cofactor cytidylyltransferase/nicotine blue oxidoreductase